MRQVRRGLVAFAAASLTSVAAVVAPVGATGPASFTADLTQDWVHGRGFAADGAVSVVIGAHAWTSPTDAEGGFSLDLSAWNEQGNEPFDVGPGRW